MTTVNKAKLPAHRPPVPDGSRAGDTIDRTPPRPAAAKARLHPTSKLTAAMNGPVVGPFKTKTELFDALDAKDAG